MCHAGALAWGLRRRVGDERGAVLRASDDRLPAGVAALHEWEIRLVREGSIAEIAFEVVDEHQQRGIGSALTAELLADARAAGITEVTALVATDNTAAVSLLRRVLGRLDARFEGTELSVRAALA